MNRIEKIQVGFFWRLIFILKFFWRGRWVMFLYCGKSGFGKRFRWIFFFRWLDFRLTGNGRVLSFQVVLVFIVFFLLEFLQVGFVNLFFWFFGCLWVFKRRIFILVFFLLLGFIFLVFLGNFSKNFQCKMDCEVLVKKIVGRVLDLVVMC